MKARYIDLSLALMAAALAGGLGWLAGSGHWGDVVLGLSMLCFGLWTTPKTWTATLVTVADMNLHVRDNLNILKTSITDTGTILAGSAIIGAAQGNKLGYRSGSITAPTAANTNVVLFDDGPTSGCGVGVDPAGVFYVATGNGGGIAARLKIDGGGSVTIPGATVCGPINASVAYLGDAVPLMRGYAEKWQGTINATGGAFSFDISNGNHVLVGLVNSITSFTMTASLFGILTGFTWPIVFHIIGDGTGPSGRAITWTINGSPILFSGGVAPTIAYGSGKVTRVVVYYMAGFNAFGEQIGYNA